MIKILRAFHGVRASGSDDVMRDRQCDDVSGDPLCTYCPGDCVDDSINEVSVLAYTARDYNLKLEIYVCVEKLWLEIGTVRKFRAPKNDNCIGLRVWHSNTS